MPHIPGNAKWTTDETPVDSKDWEKVLAAFPEGRDRSTLTYLKSQGGTAQQGNLFDCTRGRSRGAERINRSLKCAGVMLRLVLDGKGSPALRPWRLVRIVGQ